jgi:hypothetical protein
MTSHSPAVLVTLRESTVALLMTLRQNEGETLDSVAARCAGTAIEATPQVRQARPAPLLAEPPTYVVRHIPTSTWPTTTSGYYRIKVFDVPIGARTLGKLFAAAVDAIHDLDPAAIERLSRKIAYTRRFVALDKKDIHAGRLDLALLQTRSGWWVSGNIGRRDLTRALHELCKAADLEYGQDVRLVT